MRKLLTDMSTVTRCRVVAIAILVFSSKKMIAAIVFWQKLKGWEAYLIAQALVEGKGYSFPSMHRWLFEVAIDDEYHLTAWVDPLYTYCLAALIWLFGDYHQLAAAIFNYLLFIAVFILTYHLVERFISSKAAVLAVLLLALSKFSAITSTMSNTFLAASLILISVLVLVKFFEKPCFRSASILGLTLGINVLGCPSAQLFIPVTAISIIFWGRKKLNLSITHSIIVCITSVAIIAPWTIRNYLVFDEFIPVRSGVGQIVFAGAVAVADPLMQNPIMSSSNAISEHKSPRELIFDVFHSKDKRLALEQFEMNYAKEVGPEQWVNMNEAQRDKWFLKESKQFILDNPEISLQLAAAKFEVFVRVLGKTGMFIMLLSLFGALVTLKNATVSTISLWVGSYIGPFFLILTYFPRYRAPIEPLLTLLAVFAINWLYKKCREFYSVPDREAKSSLPLTDGSAG